MITTVSIGASLAQARSSKNITATELFYETGITGERILKIESGDTDYSMNTFLRLCKGMNVSPVAVLRAAHVKDIAKDLEESVVHTPRQGRLSIARGGRRGIVDRFIL